MFFPKISHFLLPKQHFFGKKNHCTQEQHVFHFYFFHFYLSNYSWMKTLRKTNPQITLQHFRIHETRVQYSEFFQNWRPNQKRGQEKYIKTNNGSH